MSKKKKAAEGGLFASAALGMLERDEFVQIPLFQIIESRFESREVIYFVKARKLPYIKIGYTSYMEVRLRQLDGANPFGVEILLVMAGDEELEKSLHDKFVMDKHRKEWFHYSDAIKSFVKQQETLGKNLALSE